MKRFFSLILALVYLFFTIGATIHRHYCMGELIDTSLFDQKNQACGKCGMEKHTEENKGCCEDVLIIIKTGDSHAFSQTVNNFSFPPIIIPAISFIVSDDKFKKDGNSKLFRAPSPPLLKHPLFIQHQNFRI